MRIAIIGTGNVGRRDSARAVREGPCTDAWARVTRKSRRVWRWPGRVGAALVTPSVAAVGAEVVILALPWAAAEGAVAALGDLAGKVVIDCMNPLGHGRWQRWAC